MMFETTISTIPGDVSPQPVLKEGVASVLGYRMAYVTGGSGEPVVFLHALGHASSAWDGVLPHLARRFRVFALDMLGCGRSDKPRIDYHLWALATYTRHFLDAVGVERAHLVGHSLGGGIAMQMMLQYPERVRKLALLSTGGLGREVRLLLRVATLPGVSLALASLTQPFWLRLLERLRFASLTQLLARENMRVWTRLAQADNRWVFMRMLRSVCNITWQTVSALDRLPLLEQPVLLIWGERDRTVPVSHAQRAATLLPNCQLEILPNCAHYPAIEQPHIVAPLLEQFLLAEDGMAAVAAGELECAD